MRQVVRRGQCDANEFELGRLGIHDELHAGDARNGPPERMPTEGNTLRAFRSKLLLQIGEENVKALACG